MNNKYKYLPEVNIGETTKGKPYIKFDIIGNSSCPCCEFITVPNNGNVLAYICPVCFWEIDLFIHSDGESSDLNHELTLIEARKNCKQFGAVLPDLKDYCRQPQKHEYPVK